MSSQSYNVGRYGDVEVLTLAPRREADRRATSDGAWDAASTWESGSVPGDGDRVLVDEGVTVTVADRRAERLPTVRVDGTLSFDPSANAKLRVDTMVVSKTGRLEIGTGSDPIHPSVTAEIEILQEVPLERPNDPRLVGRGILAMGRTNVEIHGAPKTTWDVLDGHARAGDTAIALSGDGPAALDEHGWRVGDEIVFPDQEPWGGVPAAVADSGVSPTATHDDEVRTVSAVDGGTISFDEPLESDHVPPEDDIDSYVLNLTRNVRISSEADDPDEFGHVMFMSAGVSVAYAACRDMGRTARHERMVSNPLWNRGESTTPILENQRARYPIHFHRTGPEAPTNEVLGCCVRDTPGWAYVNHGSAADVTDSVSYMAHDAGFVTEAGDEAGSFERNFALRSYGSGEESDSRKGWSNTHGSTQTDPPGNIDDFGHHGVGFWIHSPIIEVANNVAAGHRAHGFHFFHRALVERPLADDEFLDGKTDMLPVLPRSRLTPAEQRFGNDGTEAPFILHGEPIHESTEERFFASTCRLRRFEDNTAFGCGAGVEFRSVAFRNRHPRHRWARPSGFLAYNVGDHYLADGSTQGQFENFQSTGTVGIDHRYVGNLTNTDYTLIGPGGEGVGSACNRSYTDEFDLEGCEIRGWEYGYTPKLYQSGQHCEVRDSEFDNETDVLLRAKFPRDLSGLYLAGNEYRGQNRLEWGELGPASSPIDAVQHEGFLTWEGRNVYHGWSAPDFVLVREGDTDRLDTMLSRNGDRWRDHLDGDDPASVLPGATHRELYESYGILFYGGMLDPADGEQPGDFVGSGGPYDSTPYLGAGPKSQPCDEVWIDATEMTLEGDAEVIAHGDGTYDDGTTMPLEAPLQGASDGTAVELRRADQNSPGLPVQSGEGVAAYTFEIDRTGVYQCHTRSMQGADVSNTNQGAGERSRFWIRFDGGDWQLHEGGGDGVGVSDTSGFSWARDKIEPWIEHEFTSTGDHTIEVAGKGANMRLDKVLLCHETVAAAPIGPGKSHTN